VAFFSATLPAPYKANLAVCFIGGWQRQLQPERYAKYNFKLVGIIKEII
jgi:hypothetical protein